MALFFPCLYTYCRLFIYLHRSVYTLYMYCLVTVWVLCDNWNLIPILHGLISFLRKSLRTSAGRCAGTNRKRCRYPRFLIAAKHAEPWETRHRRQLSFTRAGHFAIWHLEFSTNCFLEGWNGLIRRDFVWSVSKGGTKHRNSSLLHVEIPINWWNGVGTEPHKLR